MNRLHIFIPKLFARRRKGAGTPVGCSARQPHHALDLSFMPAGPATIKSSGWGGIRRTHRCRNCGHLTTPYPVVLPATVDELGSDSSSYCAELKTVSDTCFCSVCEHYSAVRRVPTWSHCARINDLGPPSSMMWRTTMTSNASDHACHASRRYRRPDRSGQGLVKQNISCRTRCVVEGLYPSSAAHPNLRVSTRTNIDGCETAHTTRGEVHTRREALLVIPK
ncbi:uncharacterized protein BDZ83DRAFT_313263 [Colletotrichum acutatum]|uniref:Uncharacterized protein n=1 Tax=Glomerella acutata TaxID=27357 RepID=A0AAD8UQ31_GLOAC|nr:uncharacterized protein BDZ83DRAFT_313263 [Colletotrichum acutatum]KAK1725139.1 hypothetical protein BDZ83DRAFT_313263 [Colletotrichum acutatum]